MAGIGISAYGVYIPRYRLSRKTISEAMGWLSPGALPGEKAVANYDEDSLTMAVAAGVDCLKGADRAGVDGLYFASTTSPYRERESAAIIATALDLSPNIRTADFANSLKAGTRAIVSAYDSVKAKGGRSILVCGSDYRLGKPGSSQEMVFGDGAAALLLGSSGVIASLEGWYSTSYDFPDYRRSEDDKFVRAAEDRFIREEGYAKFIPEAILGLLRKYELETKDFAKVAYPCLNLREHAAIGKRLGFQPNQIQEPLFTAIGESGTASPLMLLVAMLEEAKPGDNILLVSYGNGAEALLFKVTEEIEKVRDRERLKKYLAFKKELTSYEKYLAFRGIIPVEVGPGGEVAPTQLPLTWRERKVILALYGSKCKRCGTPQYPPQRICVNPDCGAVDEMEDYCFSDKRGALFSYTADRVASSIDPPLLYGMIDFDGGGRFVFELTDCELDLLKVGMPVEMSLRRKYLDESRGIHGYFWKAIPIRE
ncbi:MAG: OB-fold domain-containing protein [Dehalococcoidia bacterium]|nr:OB-fold domain-containing protein [Dehalococcoidia bacterium]